MDTPEQRDAEQDIPEEISKDQRLIPFEGDELMATVGEGGGIYITVPGMCSALGLNTQGQIRRMQRSKNLSRGLRLIELQTARGRRKTTCLRLGKIAMWLAGIETGRMENDQAAEKIDRYQEELEPVATEVFFRSLGAATSPPTPPTDLVFAEDSLGVEAFLEEHIRITLETYVLPHIDLRFSQQEMKLDQIIGLLTTLVHGQEAIVERQVTTEQEIEKIDSRTQHLSPVHKRHIKEQIDLLVAASKHDDQPLTYIQVYGKLKGRYRVAKYDEIADDRYQEVLDFLHAFPSQAIKQGNLF